MPDFFVERKLWLRQLFFHRRSVFPLLSCALNRSLLIPQRKDASFKAPYKRCELLDMQIICVWLRWNGI